VIERFESVLLRTALPPRGSQGFFAWKLTYVYATETIRIEVRTVAMATLLLATSWFGLRPRSMR
jgi:hypothetical protein